MAGTGVVEVNWLAGKYPLVIVGFTCYNCAYAAADLAGSMRLSYNPAVNLVGIPCTGAVEPVVILSALEEGADGVFVAGCLDGECHYKTGNLHAKQRVAQLRSSLEQMGLEPERLEMFQLSAAMGARFAEMVDQFVGRIYELGPSPIRPGLDCGGRSQ